jgi:hypothetical protein
MSNLWPDSIARLVERQTEELQRKRTRLTAERSAIDDQLQQVERDLNELEIAVRVYRRFSESGSPGAIAQGPAEQAASGRPPSDVTSGVLERLDGVTVAEAAERGLRFLGGEADSGELRDLLINRGAIRPDQNSYGYLLKQMSRKTDRFVKIARGRWALAEGVS